MYPPIANSPSSPPAAQRLAASSPLFVIAVMIHVVVIAVASIVYFAKDLAADDDAPTEMKLAAPTPVDDLQPPEIVDRLRDDHQVPQLQIDDVLPSNERELEPDATDDPEQGSDDPSHDLPSNIPDGGGSTAIAPGPGPGFFNPVPSARTGLQPSHHWHRGDPDGRGKGPGGPGGFPANACVIAGLEWLRRHQDEDGHWDTANFMKHDGGEACDGAGNPVHDAGITGLALLAFIGHGSTLRLGPYRKVVQKGIKWLQAQQREDGLIGMPSSNEYMYSHAIATLAVCEAYGLSDSYKPLKKPAQDAINFIAQARNPYGVWRYQPRDNDGDTSITGWMVQALLSAKEFGLAVDASALANARTFFDSVTDPATGRAGYTRRGEGSSRPAAMVDRFPAAKTEAMTAVVLLCRCLMAEDPKENKTMALAADTILKQPPVWNTSDGSIDMYHWYYASYALFQMSDKHWQSWSRQMTPSIVRTQRQDGNFKGSWDPVDAWGPDGGRVYSTAMMVLCLEAYYRYRRVLGSR